MNWKAIAFGNRWTSVLGVIAIVCYGLSSAGIFPAVTALFAGACTAIGLLLVPGTAAKQ